MDSPNPQVFQSTVSTGEIQVVSQCSGRHENHGKSTVLALQYQLQYFVAYSRSRNLADREVTMHSGVAGNLFMSFTDCWGGQLLQMLSLELSPLYRSHLYQLSLSL